MGLSNPFGLWAILRLPSFNQLILKLGDQLRNFGIPSEKTVGEYFELVKILHKLRASTRSEIYN